jgi:hypothetical protein
MRFEHLSRAEQRYEIDSALPSLLAEIDRVTPTVIIVARLARLLDADPAYITGLVIQIARDGHPQARQDGEIFKRYGKTMHRWQWYPLAPLELTHEMLIEYAKTLADYSRQELLDELERRATSLSSEKTELPSSTRGDEISIDQSDW